MTVLPNHTKYFPLVQDYARKCVSHEEDRLAKASINAKFFKLSACRLWTSVQALKFSTYDLMHMYAVNVRKSLRCHAYSQYVKKCTVHVRGYTKT